MSNSDNKPGPSPAPLQKSPKDSDDGVLDSIGKAIADPVKSGAEDEEPTRDGRVPQTPGG